MNWHSSDLTQGTVKVVPDNSCTHQDDILFTHMSLTLSPRHASHVRKRKCRRHRTAGAVRIHRERRSRKAVENRRFNNAHYRLFMATQEEKLAQSIVDAFGDCSNFTTVLQTQKWFNACAHRDKLRSKKDLAAKMLISSKHHRFQSVEVSSSEDESGDYNANNCSYKRRTRSMATKKCRSDSKTALDDHCAQMNCNIESHYVESSSNEGDSDSEYEYRESSDDEKIHSKLSRRVTYRDPALQVRSESSSSVCTTEACFTDGIQEDTDEEEIHRHNWVYDLKALDFPNTNEGFSKKNLVVVRGDTKSISLSSWNAVQLLSSSNLKHIFEEVIFIPRSENGQVYIIRGLAQSLHFSLGSIASKKLKSFCYDKKLSIVVAINRNVNDLDLVAAEELNSRFNHLYVETYQALTKTPLQKKTDQLMLECANHLWGVLFGSASAVVDENRAKNIINLGLTDRKIDQLERISITGRIGLNLIQTTTQSMRLEPEALRSIAKLLVHINNEILPTTPYKDVFKLHHNMEKFYVGLFGRQILLTEEQLFLLVFAAMSFVVNGDLNPHYDKSNPHPSMLDWTVTVGSSIPIMKVPEVYRERVRRLHPYSIPFCAIGYKRDALVNLCRRFDEVNTYLCEDKYKTKGRQQLVELLRNVGSCRDFQGRWMNRNVRKELPFLFYNNEEYCFDGDTYVSDEAVDKMVSFHTNIIFC